MNENYSKQKALFVANTVDSVQCPLVHSERLLNSITISFRGHFNKLRRFFNWMWVIFCVPFSCKIGWTLNECLTPIWYPPFYTQFVTQYIDGWTNITIFFVSLQNNLRHFLITQYMHSNWFRLKCYNFEPNPEIELITHKKMYCIPLRANLSLFVSHSFIEFTLFSIKCLITLWPITLL